MSGAVVPGAWVSRSWPSVDDGYEHEEAVVLAGPWDDCGDDVVAVRVDSGGGIDLWVVDELGVLPQPGEDGPS